MKVKAHYDQHLAHFYSWMVGDFDSKRKEFQHFLEQNKVFSKDNAVAIDLGAGHGIQSIALHNVGFNVTAIDFNEHLLAELKTRPEGEAVKIVLDDIAKIKNYSELNPSLISCCGDTLPHLKDKKSIETFITDCSSILKDNGKLILSFRDYSFELKGSQRFIPVKSDENRILTCLLEYEPETVTVTDILHEKIGQEWQQKVSSYPKVRIATADIIQLLKANQMELIASETSKGMTTLIAKK